MAARETELTSSLSVRCAICLDTLHVPKALPCLHTFCLNCLQLHIAVTVKSRSDKITCPECRSKCCPPNASRPISEWAGDFPVNFHLQNVIEASAHQQGDKFARRLKDARAFVDNRLMELGAEIQHLSMARADVTDAWQQSKEAASQAFASLMSAVKEREEQLVKKLDEDYVECTRRLYDREEQIGVKMEQLRRFSDVITDVMTGETQHQGQGLEEIDRQLRDAQDMESDADEVKLSESLVIEADDVAGIIRSLKDLGTFRTAPQGVGEAITPPARTSGSQLPVHEITNRSGSTQKTHQTRRACETPRGGQPPVYLTHVQLKSPGDKKEPFVTGVCSLPGVLLLTDVNNRTVKGMYLPRQGGRAFRLHDLPLRSDPLCVTATAPGQAAVGSECCLYLVSVDTKLRLGVKQTIRLRKCYYGIAALPDTGGQRVAACSDQPPSVDIINLQSGQVTRTISKDSSGSTLFTSPFYLTAMPGGRLLVSDKDNTAQPLTCLTSEGSVLYRYCVNSTSSTTSSTSSSPQPTWPLGVSGSSSGDCLVVDAAMHAVFRLSGEGRVVEKLVEDSARLSSPSALCLDEGGRRLYVVGNKGKVLLVYDFSV
ncbi:hypothetical protein BaRGS_00014112 [Batillaria attramentaria]|uniref:RING-type domain-containing protein n=1 Tax=Batillaria attramentaria TaxID=370345 RepID=A0ABD0L553_9CAEN